MNDLLLEIQVAKDLGLVSTTADNHARAIWRDPNLPGKPDVTPLVRTVVYLIRKNIAQELADLPPIKQSYENGRWTTFVGMTRKSRDQRVKELRIRRDRRK